VKYLRAFKQDFAALFYFFLSLWSGLDEAIAERMVRRADPADGRRTVWECRDCRKICRLKSDMSRHIEGAHLAHLHPGIPCPHCAKVSKTRNALRNHIYSAHNLKYIS
jgi:uncharacterized C2H2 Zn-finger protein